MQIDLLALDSTLFGFHRDIAFYLLPVAKPWPTDASLVMLPKEKSPLDSYH